MKTGVGRRGFIKTTVLASAAAALPGKGLESRNTRGSSAPLPGGVKKKLLCLSDNPAGYEAFIESVKSLHGTVAAVSSVKVNFQKPEEIVRTIHEHKPDVLFMALPRFTFNFGSLYDSMGDLDIPIIVLTTNPELILIDANLAASLRANGAQVAFALSQEQALEFLKLAASPRILEGRRAVLFGRPFDSTTVPAHNLSEGLVSQRTGVRVQYQPIAELAARIKEVDVQAAGREMERWKRGAKAIIRVSNETLLDAGRLYVLLRSIVEKEGLAAVSIDCLGFTISPNPVLPYPCLAFSRLRDEGITAACEADVCAMLSSMFLEEINRKPSFMCNVMSVDARNSEVLVSHCAAPLKLNGLNAPPMNYKLHDYHGLGRGVVPEVAFPQGGEVIIGAFSKNLKSFSLWPGRIKSQVLDTDQTSMRAGPMMNVCANTMVVKIKDAGRFVQNIPGIHEVMVMGSYSPAIEDALFAMNMDLEGPKDFTPPAL